MFSLPANRDRLFFTLTCRSRGDRGNYNTGVSETEPANPVRLCPPGDACHAAAPVAGVNDGVAGGVHPILVEARILGLLPEQLLQPGETIILLIKPSPWSILLSSLRSLLILGLLTLLMLASVRRGYVAFFSSSDVLLIGMLLLSMRLVVQFMDWLGRIYVLTDRRVVSVQGVMRVHVFECSLKRVQHTTATFSLWERIFCLGTIGFSTAGQVPAIIHWRMVDRPMQVHRTVVQTLERYR